MHCVDFLFVLSCSFEDMGISHVFIYLSVMGRYNPPPIKTKVNMSVLTCHLRRVKYTENVTFHVV